MEITSFSPAPGACALCQAGPGTPDPWGKSHKLGTSLSILEPLVTGTKRSFPLGRGLDQDWGCNSTAGGKTEAQLPELGADWGLATSMQETEGGRTGDMPTVGEKMRPLLSPALCAVRRASSLSPNRQLSHRTPPVAGAHPGRGDRAVPHVTGAATPATARHLGFGTQRAALCACGGGGPCSLLRPTARGGTSGPERAN